MLKDKSDVLKIADIDKQDTNGNTLLHWAADAGEVDIVKELLAKKARAGLTNFAGDTPFSKAAKAGRIEVLQAFEDAGYDWRADRNYRGETPLYQAAQNGHLPAVMWLAERGAFVDVPSSTDMPLHAALKNKHLDVAAYIITESATPEYRDCTGKKTSELILNKILNPKKEDTDAFMLGLYRCLGLLMEQGVKLYLPYSDEKQDFVDFFEGAMERVEKKYAKPTGVRFCRVVQKGHKTDCKFGLERIYQTIHSFFD